MPTQIDPGVKKGGGGILGAIGTALGAIAGVVAAPVTGGASLAATAGALAGGAALGSTVGGTVGGLADKVIDPVRGDERNSGVSTESAINRRASSLAPASVTSNDSNQILEESMAALKSPEVPDSVREQYAPVISEAYGLSRKRNPRSPGGVIS